MDSLKRDIERYFEEMRVRLSVVDETKKEIDRLVAPDFSLFSILWVDEVRLSNMIARLLDPSASHGQGRKFLDAFLDTLESIQSGGRIGQFQQAWHDSSRIKVEIEQSTNMIEASQRRMDILVHGNNYGLMIENKPWAVDQMDQMSDYGKYLEARFTERYIMIYLSGDGTPPNNAGFTKEGKAEFDELMRNGNILLMAFRPHLTCWLQRCLELTEADRVRWIIKDFITYLESTFPVSSSDKLEAQ